MSGTVKRSKGKKVAEEILTSGSALRKMKEIIKAQGGDPNMSSESIKPGEFYHHFKSEKDGISYEILGKYRKKAIIFFKLSEIPRKSPKIIPRL